MPAAVPEPIRHLIWQLHTQGRDSNAIAEAVALPARTVRHLLARFRAVGGPAPADFRRCGRLQTPPFSEFRRQAVALRHQRPGWGAGRIEAHWRGIDPEAVLPDRSTVRRWLKEEGLAPPPRPKTSEPVPVPPATQAHEIWPMDAAEAKALRGGVEVCWLRLIDEASGAALFARVLGKPRWQGVGTGAVQAALRDAFTLWGRPRGLRVDNGNPWVCPDSDLPSDLELWLAGLGVALHRGRPGVPQDNSRMERSQRTVQAWSDPGAHDTPEQLQARLDEEDRVHRQVYLFDGERTRLEAWPDLRFQDRPYAPGRWEDVCWDHGGALGRLAALALERRVAKSGHVSVYDHNHLLGKALGGSAVRLRLDPTGPRFKIEDIYPRVDEHPELVRPPQTGALGARHESPQAGAGRQALGGHTRP